MRARYYRETRREGGVRWRHHQLIIYLATVQDARREKYGAAPVFGLLTDLVTFRFVRLDPDRKLFT